MGFWPFLVFLGVNVCIREKVRRLKSICVMRFFIYLYGCFVNLTRDIGENLRLWRDFFRVVLDETFIGCFLVDGRGVKNRLNYCNWINPA